VKKKVSTNLWLAQYLFLINIGGGDDMMDAITSVKYDQANILVDLSGAKQNELFQITSLLQSFKKSLHEQSLAIELNQARVSNCPDGIVNAQAAFSLFKTIRGEEDGIYIGK
jgi:hypothetical protein